MHRLSQLFLVVLLLAGTDKKDDSKSFIRPISEAESVLAVYYEDWGLASSGMPQIIVAAWPDGHIVWSRDRVKGGAPYRSAEIDPRTIAAMLERFEQDGLFHQKKRLDGGIIPDAHFQKILIKSGKKQLGMASPHELFEDDGTVAVTESGALSLEGQRRLDVLREEPKEYLFFRFVWSETRSALNNLIPEEGVACAGKPIMDAGVLSWDEPR